MDNTGKSIPDVDLYVFWDMDKTKLDVAQDKDFIISRMFERGKLEDVLKIISYYSILETKKTLAANKYLSRQGMYLANALLDIPIEHFASYAAHRND